MADPRQRPNQRFARLDPDQRTVVLERDAIGGMPDRRNVHARPDLDHPWSARLLEPSLRVSIQCQSSNIKMSGRAMPPQCGHLGGVLRHRLSHQTV